MSDGFLRGPYRPPLPKGGPKFECDGAVEGVHEDHCTHELPPDAKHAPGEVCCWCGDIFAPRYDGNEHGEYLPNVRTVPKASPRGFERMKKAKKAAAKVRKGAR